MRTPPRGHEALADAALLAARCTLAGAEDADRHHLFARGGGDWSSPARQPQQVELMERSGRGTFAAAATYIEDRLRRRGRTESGSDEGPSSSGSGGAGEGEGGGGLFHRAPLFSAGGMGSTGAQQAAALASAGGRQLRQWKESLLQKLKKVSSQPALAVPPSASPGFGQLGAAAVASAPLLPGGGGTPEGRVPSMRQRPTGGGAKAD